jgi:hypothetical protein
MPTRQRLRRERRAKRDTIMSFLIGVGGLAVGLYFTVLWAAPFWFVALLFFADYVGNLDSIATWKFKEKRILQTIIVIIIGFLGFFVVRSQHHRELARELSGTLEPSSKGKAKSPILELADSGVTVDFDKEPSGQWEIIKYEHIKVRVIRGTPMFSTLIRDVISGNTIVEIKDNQWTVTSDQALSWDHNYTSDALEVMNGRHDVVLQVKILPTKVQLQGEWHDENGKGVRLHKTHFPAPEGGAGIDDLRFGDSRDPAVEINPIFVYPSIDHWGEFAMRPPR